MLKARFLRRCGYVIASMLLSGGFAWSQQAAAPMPAPIRMLEGHTKPIYAVAYSPDGKFIYTASFDHTVKIWDRVTGQVLRTYADHKNGVLALAVSKNGQQFASAGLDRQIHLYDVPIRDPLFNAALGGDGVGVTVSGDGTLLITADKGPLLRLWNGVTGAHVRDFPGLTAPVTGIVLTAENKQVVASTADGFVRIWDVTAGTLLSSLSVPSATALDLSADGLVIATVGVDGAVRVSDRPSGPPKLLAGHTQPLAGVAISKDGKQAVTVGADQTVRRFDLTTVKEVKAYAGQVGAATSLAVTPTFDMIATGNATGQLKFWKIDGTDMRGLSGHTGTVPALAFHPAGKLIASGGQDGMIRLWQLPPGEPKALPGHSQPVQAIAVSPSGKLIVTAAADKLGHVYSDAGKLVKQLAGSPQPLTNVAVTFDEKMVVGGDAVGGVRAWTIPDGKPQSDVAAFTGAVTGLVADPKTATVVASGADGTIKFLKLPFAAPKPVTTHANALVGLTLGRKSPLAFSAAADQVVKVTSLETGKDLKTFAGLTAAPSALGLTPDEALLAIGQANGLLKFYTVADGKPASEMMAHAGAVHAIAFHPKATQWATAGLDGFIRVWESPVRGATALAGHTKPLQAVAVSADGKLLATAGADQTIRLWQADGKAVATLEGHAQPVTAVSIQAAGLNVVSADAAGKVRVWNPAAGPALTEIGAHTGPVTSVVMHPTLPQFATSGADGLVKIWQLPVVPGKTLPVHAQESHAVAVSADGKFVVSAAEDGVVRVVDPATSKVTVELKGQTGAVRSLIVSPDNAQVLSASADGSLRVWKSADGADLGAVTGSEVPVLAAALHPKGLIAATGSQDSLIRLWQLPIVAPRVLATQKQGVTAAALSPNGQLLATALADNSIVVWNVANGQPSKPIAGHTAAVTSLAWRADSAALVSGSADKTARIWTVADGKQVTVLDQHGAAIGSVAVTAAGDQVFTGGADNLIKQWGVADGKVIKEFKGHGGAVSALVLSKDAATLYSGGADSLLKAWTVATAAEARSINHGAAISAISVSPDGAKLASAGADNLVKLWNAADGAAASVLTGHAGAVTGVSFTADGLRVASSSADGTLRVWEPTGALLQTYRAGKGALQALAVSPDSKTVMAAGADAQIHIVTPAAVRAIPGHTGAVQALAFNPAGDRLVSGGTDKTVRAWNLADGAAATQYAGATDAITTVKFTADGLKLIAGGVDKQVRIWNAADGVAGPIMAQPAAVRDLAPSIDLTKVVVVGDDAIVRVWDLVSGKELETFTGHAGIIHSVALAADNKTLYTAGADKSVRQWTVAAQRVIAAHEGKANGVVYSPDGLALLSAGDDKLIKMWLPTGAAVRQFAGSPVAITGLAVRGDSLQVAGAVADNSVMLWNFDGTPFAALPKLALPAAITSLRYSADNLKLAVSSGDAHVRVFNPADGKLLQAMPQAGVPAAVTFTPDNKSLLIGSADNSARLVPYSLLRLIAGHEGAVNSLAYVPTAEQLVSGGTDKTVRLWNLADGAAIRTFAGHTDIVTSVAVTPDGTQVLAAGQDKNVRTWKTADGAPVATLLHPAAVRSLSVSADGLRIATSGDDAIARVWDLAAGKELQFFPGHTAAIPAVSLSTDGQSVVTASHDKTVRIAPISATRVIAAHPVIATAVVLTADGTQTLSSGDDKIVKLWDATGKLVRQFAGSQTPLRRLAIRPDSKQVAGGGDAQLTDKGLYLWDFNTAALTVRIETPAAVTGVAYSPDGSQIAVSQADNRLRIYASEGGVLLEDIPTPQPPQNVAYLAAGTLVAGQADNQSRIFGISIQKVLTGHMGAVNSIVYSDNGELLLSAGADKTLRVWSVATGQVVMNLAGCTDVITSASFSPDQKSVIASSIDKNVRIWALPEKLDPKAAAPTIAPTTTVVHLTPVQSAVFSPDGTTFASAGDDFQVHVWDRKTGLELERFLGHTAIVTRLGYAADGLSLISGANDNTSRVWPITTRAVQQAHKGPATAVKFAGAGKSVVTAGEDFQVVLWALKGLEKQLALAGATLPVRALSVSKDGAFIAAGGDDKQLRIWNAEDGKPVAVEPTPAAITSLTWSPSGTKILAGGADNIARTYGREVPAGGKNLPLLQEGLGHTAAVTAGAFTADERALYTVSVDRTWKRWLSAGASPAFKLAGHKAQIYGMDFTPDGKLLASASGDKTVQIWNVADGKPTVKCEGHTGQVYAVSFTPNGAMLASAGADKVIRLWKLDGTLIKELKEGVDDGLYSLQFYADNVYLLSAGLARTWQFWNTADGKSMRTATGHTDHIYRAVFNPAWNRVASVDYSGHLFLWDTGSGNPLHHQQLPVTAAYSIGYSPDGKELAIGSQDNRLIVLTVPAAGQ